MIVFLHTPFECQIKTQSFHMQINFNQNQGKSLYCNKDFFKYWKCSGTELNLIDIFLSILSKLTEPYLLTLVIKWSKSWIQKTPLRLNVPYHKN